MTRDRRLQILERRARAGELGAGIGHEVRNVLTGVLGFAQLVGERTGDPAEVARLAAVIERETGRALEILQSLLAVARPARSPGTVDLNRLVMSAAELARPSFRLRGVDVVVALDPQAVPVPGDAGGLRQVLLNLAFNAAQAMPEGGGVRLSTAVEGDELVVRVADDGPGVPPELRDRIFTAFFTTRPGGTGLGLSVSAAIVAEHGGVLALEPSARGATFAVRLPQREVVDRSTPIEVVSLAIDVEEGGR